MKQYRYQRAKRSNSIAHKKNIISGGMVPAVTTLVDPPGSENLFGFSDRTPKDTLDPYSPIDDT